jgi:hypothetical protein
MTKNKQFMRILARHKRVDGATITESVSEDGTIRRYTATIRGWRAWKIYEGRDWNLRDVIAKAREIRDRIDSGDESVFQRGGYEPLSEKETR